MFGASCWERFFITIPLKLMRSGQEGDGHFGRMYSTYEQRACSMQHLLQQLLLLVPLQLHFLMKQLLPLLLLLLPLLLLLHKLALQLLPLLLLQLLDLRLQLLLSL